MAIPSAEMGEGVPESPNKDLNWYKAGVCNDNEGTMLELFYSTDREDVERAKALCRGCIVNVECLQYAKETRQYGGVWGGELFDSGKIVPTPKKKGPQPATNHSVPSAIETIDT